MNDIHSIQAYKVNGFPPLMSGFGSNKWLRGGAWAFVGDAFYEQLELGGMAAELVPKFLQEMDKTKELLMTADQEFARNVDPFLAKELRPGNWAVEMNDLVSRQLGFNDVNRYAWIKKQIVDDLSRREQYITESIKMYLDNNNMEECSPLEDSQDAYLKFASIVDDIWESNDDDMEDKRKVKMLEFCERYGPPNVITEPDLDIGFAALTHEESSNRRVNEVRLNTLIRFYDSGNLPLVVRFNYPNAIVEASMFALALRCHQMLQGGEQSWEELQPGLKQYLKSPEAVTMFASHSLFTGEDIHPWKMSASDGHKLTKNPEEWLDQPEFWQKYLPYLINLGPFSYSQGTPYVIFDSDIQGYKESVQYDTLMNMMWHQLRQAIIGGTSIKRCVADDCSILFDIARPLDRKIRRDRQFCSDRCKSRMSSRKFRNN